jgi:hypothetical protein
MWAHIALEGNTMIATAIRIKTYSTISRVHHTIRTNLVHQVVTLLL